MPPPVSTDVPRPTESRSHPTQDRSHPPEGEDRARGPRHLYERRATDRFELAVGRVVEPLDRALSRVGRWCAGVGGAVEAGIGAAFEPLERFLGVASRAAGAASGSIADALGAALGAIPVPEAVRRQLWVTAHPSASGAPPTQVTIKSRYDSMLRLGVIASAFVHMAFFAFSPTLHADDVSYTPEEITAIELPPEVEIPPPPTRIARPATPVISATAVDEDITIAPTTFADNPIADLPPPPPDVTVVEEVESAPTFTPYTVAPRLLNQQDIARGMLEEYPPALRDSGIEGVVIVWVYIDEEGVVQDTRVYQSSGFEPLDDTALRVASDMEFSPAMNRDRRVEVWIQIPLEFGVR